MSKGYKDKKKGRVDKFSFSGDEEMEVAQVYHTSNGHTLKLIPVAPTLLQKIESSIPKPEVPRYAAETAYGEIQTFDHDESTIETDSEKQEWQDFKAAKYLRQIDLTTKGNRAILTRGVEIPENVLEKFDEWEEDQKWLGITDIPTDPRERKYHFLLTEILAIPRDLVGALERIMKLTGIDQESLQAAEDSFLSGMET